VPADVLYSAVAPRLHSAPNDPGALARVRGSYARVCDEGVQVALHPRHSPPSPTFESLPRAAPQRRPLDDVTEAASENAESWVRPARCCPRCFYEAVSTPTLNSGDTETLLTIYGTPCPGETFTTEAARAARG
jgi:hypothetical protein